VGLAAASAGTRYPTSAAAAAASARSDSRAQRQRQAPAAGSEALAVEGRRCIGA